MSRPQFDPLEDRARFRQGAYRLLAGLLLYPDRDRLQAALEAAREIERLSKGLGDPAILDDWLMLRTALESACEIDLLGLQAEYIRLFVASSEGVPCAPYESVHLDAGGYAAGWIMAQLDQEYASEGLDVAPSLHELPDHVAVEMEFMSFLCRQEAESWRSGNKMGAVKMLTRQAGFLEGHLARWIPEWAKRVAVSDSERTYSIVTETARAFIDRDRDLVRRLLEEHGLK